MKPTEVSLQTEPAPSRTRSDTCHAPCRRSRDPGHERVVTGTNPAAKDCRRRSSLVVRTHGLSRQRRRPEAFCAASLHSLSSTAPECRSRHFLSLLATEVPHATRRTFSL